MMIGPGLVANVCKLLPLFPILTFDLEDEGVVSAMKPEMFRQGLV